MAHLQAILLIKDDKYNFPECSLLVSEILKHDFKPTVTLKLFKGYSR